MTPEQMAALDALTAVTLLPERGAPSAPTAGEALPLNVSDAAADAKTFTALQADLERFKGVPEFIGGLPEVVLDPSTRQGKALRSPPAPRTPSVQSHAPRGEETIHPIEPPSVQLYMQTADQPDDWCELRLETRAGKIRMTWKSADGDMRDSEWRLRERSNTQLALFVGFLKSFVAKSFGRVPVLKQENVAPLDKPGEPV